MTLLRVGILGAASITRDVLLRPAATLDGVSVTAVAARDPGRAAAYAIKHSIPRMHTTYEALLRDPDIDAVYLPLPPALHAEWTIAAIEAGKHVLCEKPFTSNTDAAVAVSTAAASSSVVVMEAYHSYYHPLRQRLIDILTSDELGEIRSASASFCLPIPPGRNIRWNYAVGGGGLLDVGYYPLRLLRDLLGDVVVTRARASVRGDIDAAMSAHLTHDTGVTSRMRCAIWSTRLFAMNLRVIGTRGRMSVGMPYHPHMGGRVRIASRSGRRSESPDRRSTYSYQLEAFRNVITSSSTAPTGPREAIAQQTAIDAIYQAAGMRVRPNVVTASPAGL